MALLIIMVFGSVFTLFVLILVAGGSGQARETKQTLAVLEAALATDRVDRSDQLVDIRKAELFSSIPLVNRLLLQMEIAPRVRSLLYQANLRWTVGTFFMMTGCSVILPGYFVYLRTHQVLVSVAVGLVCGLGPIVFVSQKRKMRFRKMEHQLPEATDLMVNSLRAGHSLTSALDVVAKEAPEPLANEFRICYDEQNYGLELRTAMGNLVARVPVQDLRLVVAAILIQKESGGNLAEVLEKTSEVIRERFRLARQVRVHTAQGRMTGWILSLLPVFLGVGLYFVAPDNISLLWKRDIGVKLLWGSAISTTIGALIINKIVNFEV